MSRYISTVTNSSYSQILQGLVGYNSGSNSNKSAIIAKSSQPPTFGQTKNEIEETKLISTPNYDGGISFSLPETFRQAIKQNNKSLANSTAITILERLSIFGTCETRVDINATKLTEESCKLFYEISLYNIDLTLNTLKSVYNDARAPKNSHMVYLISRLTSASRTNSLTEQQAITFRTKGYSFISLWRIPTHFIDWVNTHLVLCSLNTKQNTLENDHVSQILGNVHDRKEIKSKNKKSKKPKKQSKPPRLGGTGNGFRNACKSWYLKYCSSHENADKLAIQICKKPAHEGTTHKDVLSMIHLEMTSKKKCSCNKKIECKCIPQEPYEYSNLIPVACQIPLAYAVYGLEHATKILLEGIERLTHNGGDPAIEPDIKSALNILAFLCAVTKTKDDKTTSDEIINLIRLFKLTREMITNSKINQCDVLLALTIKNEFNSVALNAKRRELLLEKIPLHSLVISIYPEKELITKTTENKSLEISMPITALIRNLNRLTINGLLDRSTNPYASEVINAITKHITNPIVLQKGMVHPINIFSAWATYSKGQGFKGSQTWTAVPAINESLLNAVEVAFKGLTGFDATCAFFVDASGSMSSAGSAPGIPNLFALDVAIMLTLAFYRSTINFSNSNNKPMPNHVVGYFGNGTNKYGYNKPDLQKIKTKLSLEDINARSNSFVDITNKLPLLPDKLTFQIMKELLGNGQHMGCTDIGAALWHLIGILLQSIDNYKSGNPLYKDLTVFRLPGFVDMILFVTDNDVNSGDQPSDVLAIYRGLVRQAFQLIPYGKDGKKGDYNELYNKYIPRMVVVATQGGNCTVGDPRDQNILNISGFDSSGPAIINAFLNNDNDNKNKEKTED